MTFADKLIRLRKQKGWSQEELADKLDVTRQAVSRWEGAQTYPDLPKIIQIGDVFGVSLDYLLKDEAQEEESASVGKERETAEKLSDEDVICYLKKSDISAAFKSVATAFFILAPIMCLYFVYAGYGENSIDMKSAVVLSAVIPFICIAVAVTMLIIGFRCEKKYKYLLTTEFALQNVGVVDDVRQKTAKVRIAVRAAGAFFVLAALGLAIGAMFGGKAVLSALVTCAFVAVDLALTLFVCGYLLDRPFRVIDAAGKYGMRSDRITKAVIAVVYWVIVSAIFCANYLLFNNTEIAVAVLVVAIILFFAVFFAIKYINTNKKK